MNVSACLVTRGDVDLQPVLASLPVNWEVIVWTNNGYAKIGEYGQTKVVGGDDLAVYGRYAAIEYASHDLIYVQDDDCVLSPESIAALTNKWKRIWGHISVGIVANMPQPFRHDFYSDHCLVGFGAVFHRDLPGAAFVNLLKSPLVDHDPEMFDEWFNRTCDIVFTALTPRVLVDVPYENLPWASDDSRMWKQPEHVAERTRMLELVRKVRDA